MLGLEVSKTKKETTYRIPLPHLSHRGTFWAPGMAEGIFVTGAFTLLVPTGRPSENQNNPVMCRLIHLVQLNTFPVNTLLDVFTGFHLCQQTTKFFSTGLLGQVSPLWNWEKCCVAVAKKQEYIHSAPCLMDIIEFSDSRSCI